ncbi:unnamed protein product, partial [Adineta steineri]
MGLCGQIMSMISGSGTQFISKHGEQESKARLKKMICIMEDVVDKSNGLNKLF